VSGAQFRGAMKFTDPQDIAAAFAAMPGVVDDIVSLSNPVFLVTGLAGIVVLTARNRWFGSMLVVLGAVNIYFYANYNGDLAHYLLATWLILAIGLGYIAEAIVARSVELIGPRAGALAWVIALMPVVLLASNFASHDQTDNRDAEQFTKEVFAALPTNAILVTYWDALTALSYEHCIEGVRSDVALRAYDEAALVVCDPVPRPLTEVAKTHPVYALQMFPDDVLGSTGLVPEPVGTIKIPWGKRYAEYDRPLLKLVPPDQAH
jgi:4-amino-4-deoxy-L-arabinose transferase-like glycosyltransferase